MAFRLFIYHVFSCVPRESRCQLVFYGFTPSLLLLFRFEFSPELQKLTVSIRGFLVSLVSFN